MGSLGTESIPHVDRLIDNRTPKHELLWVVTHPLHNIIKHYVDRYVDRNVDRQSRYIKNVCGSLGHPTDDPQYGSYNINACYA